MVNETATSYSGSRDSNPGPETIVIINCVLNAVLIFTSIIGNTLVLAAILRTPSLRSPSVILLCSLAVSDLLVGIIVQPFYITYELTKNGSLYTPWLYKAMTTMAFSAVGVSLLTMTAISVDRFMALRYHMRYPELMTTRRAMYTLGTIWFISFLLSFLTFWNMDAYYLAISFSIAILNLLSVVCYIKIFKIVRQHQLQIHAQHQAVASFNTDNNQNILRSRKSALNTFIYYIVMILCYTPLFIVMIILGITDIHVPNAWNLTDTLAFMNSSINPILYCWRLPELRTAVVKTVRKMLCKLTEQN